MGETEKGLTRRRNGEVCFSTRKGARAHLHSKIDGGMTSMNLMLNAVGCEESVQLMQEQIKMGG